MCSIVDGLLGRFLPGLPPPRIPRRDGGNLRPEQPGFSTTRRPAPLAVCTFECAIRRFLGPGQSIFAALIV